MGNPLPSSIFPTWTEYEIVWLLHSLFPAFMNGCRSLGSYLYVDVDTQTKSLLLTLQEQNKNTLLALRELQLNVKSIYNHASSKDTGNSLRAIDLATSLDENVVYDMKVTPTEKLRELRNDLQVS